ncbi:winged helix-turn-helix domain-containing protein [Roseiconus nitratireducens]|uniref:Winged helix-turn-helix domain-containing protein n=1 Tax=Roseiconus nitratireducens TaxID=2605748 RepID=A0A5M6CUI5_9BACT|nr:winged helix-turn-helix domain-containing protein [Roseiconus nitratireducens]KAA5538606.1 winged helix-turn-helix domain-containing protein [Roseiconus nitratireducens]
MSVRIVHGANEGRFEFVGQTVNQARRVLKDAFNIPDDAEALVDGREVDEDYMIRNGETLEFVRTLGHKGGLHDFWSMREVAELLGVDAIQVMSELGINPISQSVFTSEQIGKYISTIKSKNNSTQSLSNLIVDFSSMTLKCGKQGPFEIDNSVIFRLLNRLNARPCHYVHLDNLKRDVWKDEFIDDDTVHRTARRLRKRLEEMKLEGVDIKTSNGSWALLINKSPA